jgi:hypothetical protein
LTRPTPEVHVPQRRAQALAATAQLEGWRLPVSAALQPIVLLDGDLGVMALSPSAERLLLLGGRGRPLSDAVALQDLAATWDETPFVRAVRGGISSHSRVELPSVGQALDVCASAIFGTDGPIGAVVFLTAV